jgi:hypothetical protein
MHYRRAALLLAAFLIFPSIAQAEQDFYGIQMRDEPWARKLVLNQPVDPDFSDLAEGPILDQSVRGEAYLKEVNGKPDFRLTVYNDSASPVSIDYRFRDFFIIMKDGRKFPLVDNEEDSPATLEPKAKVTFAPSMGNLRIKNSDVEMIAASFDLGRARLYLFPWSKKETVSKLVSPKPADPAPMPAEGPDQRSQAGKQAKPKTPAEEGPYKKTPKRNFWDWMKLEKEDKKAPVGPTAIEKKDFSPDPAIPPSPAASGATAVSASSIPAESPASRQKLDDAIKNFVYVPSSGVGAAAASAPAAPASGESGAQVINYNRTYNFITLNLGTRDGLKKNMQVSIVRDGKLVAKATVKQIRDAVSAAAVIPDSMRSEIRAGDRVALV